MISKNLLKSSNENEAEKFSSYKISMKNLSEFTFPIFYTLLYLSRGMLPICVLSKNSQKKEEMID